jgi:Tol biopolymer transport system component
MHVVRRVLVAVLVSVTVAPLGAAPATAGDDETRGPSRSGVIVWTTREADGSEHLLVARADGAHQRVLTPAVADSGDIDAQLSPDGRWVAYEHDAPDGSTLHLVRPDGTHDHVIDVGCVDPCVAVLSPSWLSSSRLAFTLVKGPFDPVTFNAASAVLWTARLDGSDLRRLSPPGIDGSYEDYYLRVARDARYVTFKRIDNAGGHSALFRSRLDGTHQQQLTPWAISADVNDLSTAASGPTQDLVVFESFGRGDPDATFVDLATVPATCGSLADCTARIDWLTDNGSTGRRNANPQWSPDGSSMVFTDRPSIDDQNAEIWTMRYGGDRRVKISTSPGFDYRPAWGRG